MLSGLLPVQSRRTQLKLASAISRAQRAIVEHDCVSYQQRARLPNRAGGVGSCHRPTIVAHDEWRGRRWRVATCLPTYLRTQVPHGIPSHLNPQHLTTATNHPTARICETCCLLTRSGIFSGRPHDLGHFFCDLVSPIISTSARASNENRSPADSVSSGRSSHAPAGSTASCRLRITARRNTVKAPSFGFGWRDSQTRC